MDPLTLFLGAITTGLALAHLQARFRPGFGLAWAGALLFAAGMIHTHPESKIESYPPALIAFPEIASWVLVPILHALGRRGGDFLLNFFSWKGMVLGALRYSTQLFFTATLLFLWVPWGDLSTLEVQRSLALAFAAVLVLPTLRPLTPIEKQVDPFERRMFDLVIFSIVLGILPGRLLANHALELTAGLQPSSVLSLILFTGIASLVGLSLGIVFDRISPQKQLSPWIGRLLPAFGAFVTARQLGGDALTAATLTGLLESSFSSFSQKHQLAQPQALIQNPEGEEPTRLFGGLLLFSGTGVIFPEVLSLEHLSLSFMLWAALVSIQIVFQVGFSTTDKSHSPNRYLQALATGWSLYPGLIATGIVISFGLIAPGLESGIEFIPKPITITVLQIILISLVIQGATAPYLCRWVRPIKEYAPWKDWNQVQTKLQALNASHHALTQMSSKGLLHEEARTALSSAIEKRIRHLELDQQELLNEHPELQSYRWSQALRDLLTVAKDEVQSLAQRGTIPTENARLLTQLLIQRWQDAPDLSADDAFNFDEWEPPRS